MFQQANNGFAVQLDLHRQAVRRIDKRHGQPFKGVSQTAPNPQLVAFIEIEILDDCNPACARVDAEAVAVRAAVCDIAIAEKQRVALCSAKQPIHRTALQRIVPAPAIDTVAAIVAEDGVCPFLAKDPIIAGAPERSIWSTSGLDQIIARATKELSALGC
jgi:hypothetical protein